MELGNQKTYKPVGDPLKPLEKNSSRFSSDLFNLAFQRDVSRMVNILLLIITVISVIGMIYLSTRATYIPYIVRVNNTTGAIDSGGPLKVQNYEPQTAEIKYFLAKTISDVRSIPLDPVVYRTNWDQAQYFLTKDAANKLNLIMKQNGDFDNIGKETVQTKINSIELMAGTKSTYQVRWSEFVFKPQAGKVDKNQYIGTFTVTIVPPKTESDYYKNPLGLVINDLAFSLENSADSTKEIKSVSPNDKQQ